MMQRLEGHTKDVRAVAYLPDGQLVSGSSDGTVRMWNPITGEATRIIKARTPIYAIAVSPDGRSFAYAGRHPGTDADAVPIHTLRLPEGTTGTTYSFQYRPPPPSNFPTYLHRGIPRSVWSLSYSADGRTLATAGRAMGGGNIPNGAGGHWFDAADSSIHAPLASTSAFALRFAPNGEGLAITGDSIVEFYQTPRDLEPAVTYKLPSQWAAAISFIPNSPLAVVGANSALHFIDATRKAKSHKVKTGYDVQMGALMRRYDFGLGGVHAVAVAPDGCTFALAGDRGLWLFDWD
jgi:WD40 repeat protein